MTRWSSRRAARAGRAPVVPTAVGWSLLAAALDLPEGTPDDVRDLAQLAASEGRELLAGHRPAEVALLVVHPDSTACPTHARAARRVFAKLEPLTDLVAIARQVGLDAHRPDGWFLGLLLGATDAAIVRLAPESIASRRAS